MTFDEFIKKYDQKGIDFDRSYGNQCMDLMHQYIYEVLGLTDRRVLAAPGAKDVYLQFESLVGHEIFTKIPNTADGVPQKGDIVLWGEGIGPHGHVAVFVSGDKTKFASFDQNYPTGSLCHKQNHNYNAVLGWLRSKSSPAESEVPMTYDEMKLELTRLYEDEYPGRKTADQINGDVAYQLSRIKTFDDFANISREIRADGHKARETEYVATLNAAYDANNQLNAANQKLQSRIKACQDSGGTSSPPPNQEPQDPPTQGGPVNPPIEHGGDSNGGLSHADTGLLKRLIDFLRTIFREEGK